MSAPQGLFIGNARKPWRVGRVLGTGACGNVHELTRNGNINQYVVKVAPLPPPASNKKKKKSAAQRNADMLHYEGLLYQNTFVRLQGSMIARTPNGSSEPKCLEDEHGYRFLTMERMESPLTDVVGLLKSQRRGKKAIDFGPIAVALLDIVEAFHNGRYLLVDVKPDNFMLSGDQDSSIEKRIRMIDLGLMRNLRDVEGKLAPNTGDAQLVGTPLYSSLYVHEGQTFGRRDDLEAMGYVISELLMRLTGAAESLPWSNGASDEDIHRMKESEVLDNKSSFYGNMAAGGNGDNGGPAHVMWNYFKEVRKLAYKEKPDYDMLKDMLSQLMVKVGRPAAAASNKRATPVRKKESAAVGKKRATPVRKKESTAVGNKRATRGRSDKKSGTTKAAPRVVADLSDSEDEAYTGRVTRARGKKRPSPRSEAEGSNKARRRAASDDDDRFFDVDIQDADDTLEESSDGDAFESCQDEMENMEWEPTPDENAAPSNKSTGGGIGVKMMFTDGPHEGESFLLLQGTADTIVLGSDPTGANCFRLTKDPEVDPSHAKLELHVNKNLCSVSVEDLKSSTGTYKNESKMIPKGTKDRAFTNDTISIGDSTLTILRLPKGEDTPKKRAAVPASPARKKPATKKAATKNDPPTPARGIGLRCEFVEGPHDGESFLLKKGAGTKVLGTSKAKAKSDGFFLLDKDEKADASHAKLELSVSKKMCSVKVTDLKSSTGTFVNGKRIPKGTYRQAFRNDEVKVGGSVIILNSL